MLYIVKGDLLVSDCKIIAHQANCFKTFGAGFASKLKRKYPNSYKADCSLTLSPEERLGKFSYSIESNGIVVFNLYGQYSYGRIKKHTNEKAFKSSLLLMLQELDSQNVSKDIKIGLPFNVGCDLGGGDWSIIGSIIKDASIHSGRDIFLYDIKGVYKPNDRGY